MTVTLTLHLWWLAAYIAIGAVLWLPMEWWANRRTSPRRLFWRQLGRLLRHQPWSPALAIACWPLALWEALR